MRDNNNSNKENYVEHNVNEGDRWSIVLGANWRIANAKSSMHVLTIVYVLLFASFENTAWHFGCSTAYHVHTWYIYWLRATPSTCLRVVALWSARSTYWYLIYCFVHCCFVQGWLRCAVLVVDVRRHADSRSLVCVFFLWFVQKKVQKQMVGLLPVLSLFFACVKRLTKTKIGKKNNKF